MGLDMYMNARRTFYPQWEDRKQVSNKVGAAVRRAVKVKFTTGNMDTTSVQIECGYWRKANHIHKWLVDNTQGGKDECQESDVDRSQLLELKTLCERVLADHSLAAELLPVQQGFFFGSDEYDEYYFADCADTVKQIDKMLALPKDWDFTYRASW